MAMLVEVAGDHVVTSGVQRAAGPSLGGKGIKKVGVLEDGCACQPSATCQAPSPLVYNPAGGCTATATEEELGTY